MSKINQSKFKPAQYVSINYVATPDYGVTLAEVLDESYWGHVARELKAGYTIEVMPEGLPYYAKLIVVHAEPTRAIVKLLSFVDLVNEMPKPETAPIVKVVELGGFKAERNGRWFRVVRESDGEVMKGAFTSMAAAEEWAAANLKLTA